MHWFFRGHIQCQREYKVYRNFTATIYLIQLPDTMLEFCALLPDFYPLMGLHLDARPLFGL